MTDADDSQTIQRRIPQLDWPRLILWLGGFALLGPALWNGFPIVFFDTAGYIKRVLDWDLEPGRSFFYGLFLYVTSGGWFSFWGPILMQAGATLWLIHLLLRTHGIGFRDWPSRQVTGAVAIGLSALTGVSWYVAQVMPDILLPLLVLCFWLLSFRWGDLDWRERLGVAAIGLLALMSHMSSMALAGGLVLTIAAAKGLDRWRGWGLTPRVWPAAALLALSVVAMPTLHMALIGKPGFTPGGPVFIFGRLVQDGLAQRYLADHCPDPTIKLCAFKNNLPATADDFIWHKDSPFVAIGGWDSATPELSRLVGGIVSAYPGAFLSTALVATKDQLLMIQTGDGLDEWQEVTRWIFRVFMPESQSRAFEEARQQREKTTQELFDALNLMHVPVAHLSGLGLILVAIWGFRTGRRDLAALALFVLIALIGNAFINGALSNPHDRYQSRIVWLATLVVGLAGLAWRAGPTRPAKP